MSDSALDRMRARAQQVRTRAAVRRWEYRQRDLSAGVWFRLRRVLADAKAAYAISDEDARALRADGHISEACGAELSPEKTIIFIEEERLAELKSRRAIPIGLGPELLTASAVVLVPFEKRSRAPSAT